MTDTGTESLDICVVRNEVDDAYAYHCDALASRFPSATEIDFPAGDRVSATDHDAVVLTGSTAGVYERDDRPWIADQEALVRDLVAQEVPTLGVCFGHQVVNAALGGHVEHVGMTAGLVEASYRDDPLFEGVGSSVVSLHGDSVTECGDGMTVIASAAHEPTFGTRHHSAPVLTVQFHPELTAAHRDRLQADFDWRHTDVTFDDVATDQLFENFMDLARQHVDA